MLENQTVNKNTRIKIRKPLYGVGINDSDYVTQPGDRNLRCPIFDRWHSMMRRCYSENSKSRNVTYDGVEVCKDWHTYSNFYNWMVGQQWEGKALDKDLLGNGKLYSAETCCFLPSEINSFISAKTAHDTILGARLKFYDGRENPYIAQAFVDGKKKHLGVYSNPLSAHKAWQEATVRELDRLVIKWQDQLSDRVLEALLGIKVNLELDLTLCLVTTSLLNREDKSQAKHP